MMTRDQGLAALIPVVEGRPNAMIALARQLFQAGQKPMAYELCLRAMSLPGCSDEAHLMARQVLSADVPRWHFGMVQDSARNDMYEAAIRHAVRPGCRVLEIGTGTGLLAMMAARAGAGEVVTCEADRAIATSAREIVGANGFGDRVRVIASHSDALTANDIGGPVDVLVSEIVSTDLLGEGVLPVMEHAVRHLVKPDAAIIPRRGSIHVALAEDELQHQKVMGAVSGFDLSVFNRLRKTERNIAIDDPQLVLRGPALQLFDFDLTSGGPYRDEWRDVSLISDGGLVNGVAQWIALDMGNGTILENYPGTGASSCWQSRFYSFDVNLDTARGQSVSIGAHHRRTTVAIWRRTP